MCGIVGYIGSKSAVKPVLEGLSALEYRGYDSAGVTTINKGIAKTIKQIGRVDVLEAAIETEGDKQAGLAIGHTRWATHGIPSNNNAHPHSNSSETIFVVHNGIIENHEVLRSKLQDAGYVFYSETDTEVVPNLIDLYYQSTE